MIGSMLSVTLGVTIPLGYIVIGSAVGFRLRNSSVGCDRDCGVGEEGGRDTHKRGCDNGPFAVFGGIFWPVIPLVWAGYAIANRKKVFGFRVRRLERAAKKIAVMEKEIWGEALSGKD